MLSAICLTCLFWCVRAFNLCADGHPLDIEHTRLHAEARARDESQTFASRCWLKHSEWARVELRVGLTSAAFQYAALGIRLHNQCRSESLTYFPQCSLKDKTELSRKSSVIKPHFKVAHAFAEFERAEVRRMSDDDYADRKLKPNQCELAGLRWALTVAELIEAIAGLRGAVKPLVFMVVLQTMRDGIYKFCGKIDL